MPAFYSDSPAQTEALGEVLAAGLQGGELLAFTGGLGAGKTTFCRGLAKGLGCTDPVASPTFAIVNYYRGPTPLAHFDAYRITGPDDLEAAGFFECLAGGAVVAVEWSEAAAAWLPAADVLVDMYTLPDDRRKITIEGAPWLAYSGT